jgi:hypothetical protein
MDDGEDNGEQEEEEDGNDSDYLLSMAIWSLDSHEGKGKATTRTNPLGIADKAVDRETKTS